MENIDFGPEEFKILQTESPETFWKMVANAKTREVKELKEQLKPDPQ